MYLQQITAFTMFLHTHTARTLWMVITILTPLVMSSKIIRARLYLIENDIPIPI